MLGIATAAGGFAFNTGVVHSLTVSSLARANTRISRCFPRPVLQHYSFELRLPLRRFCQYILLHFCTSSIASFYANRLPLQIASHPSLPPSQPLPSPFTYILAHLFFRIGCTAQQGKD